MLKCTFLRFKGCFQICQMAVLLILMFATSSAYRCGGKETSMNLAFFCAEPYPPPEKDSPTVVMLHGVIDVKESWHSIYPHILSATGRRVCMYDARNHGDSSWNDTFTLATQVEDLGNFMEALNLERVILIGHSMGGVTAMKYALTHPEKVHALLVEDIGPVVSKRGGMFVRFVVNILHRALSFVPEGANEEQAKDAILEYLMKTIFSMSEEPPPFSSLEAYSPLHFCNGSWHWKANLDLIKRESKRTTVDLSQGEDKFEGKTLFIYGISSPFKTNEQRDAIQKTFPNSQLIGIQNAGHLIHPTFPEFRKEMLKFLNSV